MGLDMYLYKRITVEPSLQDGLEVWGMGDLVDPAKVVYFVEEAGYWRKANAIHRWFVERVQGGQDNRGRYPVSREQLRHLLETTRAVLARPELAATLLPTMEGCSFGSTDYGTGYIEDLQETERILMQALSSEGGEFEYEASW